MFCPQWLLEIRPCSIHRIPRMIRGCPSWSCPGMLRTLGSAELVTFHLFGTGDCILHHSSSRAIQLSLGLAFLNERKLCRLNSLWLLWSYFTSCRRACQQYKAFRFCRSRSTWAGLSSHLRLFQLRRPSCQTWTHLDLPSPRSSSDIYAGGKDRSLEIAVCKLQWFSEWCRKSW